MKSIKLRRRPIVCLGNLLTKLALDLGIDPVDKSYALKRLQQEGVAFVTKILPKFSAYALKCVEAGRFLTSNESLLTHFSWSGQSPRFLRGFLRKAIFQRCAVSLRIIRQFCDYLYKTCFSFTEDDLNAAESKYVEADKQVECNDWVRVEKMRKAFHTLFPELANVTTASVFAADRPYDGPGACARSSDIVRSFNLPNITAFKRLPGSIIGTCRDDLRPYLGYFKAFETSKEKTKVITEGRCAELVFVPKDSRGPRTISKEPYFLLKAQLSFQKYLSRNLTSLSKGRINFADQTVNQRISKESSKDRSYMTIDLKDASDRVANSLVKRLFRFAPACRYFTTHLRSTQVKLPSGSIHTLRKFANMGCGMCFPVLALVAYLSSVVSISETHRIPLKEASLQVYWYGDDGCVPSKYKKAVIDGLEAIGLLVNQDKSYSEGHFRESCGADYYDGVDVTPVRLRLSNLGLGPVSIYRNGYIPIQKYDSKLKKLTSLSHSGLLQLERHCRELVLAALFRTADYLYSIVERYTGALPKVAYESHALGRFDPTYVGPFTQLKAYVPIVSDIHFDGVCDYKALSQKALSPLRELPDELGFIGSSSDFSLIPLRQEVNLTRRVLEPADLACYGVKKLPYSMHVSSRRFYA